MLSDPYEAARVTVSQSTVPGGQEGLFAKRDLPAGAVVAFYNGIRFHDCHVRDLLHFINECCKIMLLNREFC